MEKYKDEEWLKQQYWDNGKSQNQIARELDENPGTIHYWMEKYDIETRDRIKEVKRKRGVNYANYYTNDRGYPLWKAGVGNGEEKVVYVSRLLAVAEYGFDAVVDKEVHHEIPIPWLNTPDNLIPLDKKEHWNQHKDNFNDRDGIESNLSGKLQYEHITESKIRELYWGNEMSIREISEELDVHRSVIKNRIDWWDIETRGKWEGHKLKYKN
jgi:transposase